MKAMIKFGSILVILSYSLQLQAQENYDDLSDQMALVFEDNFDKKSKKWYASTDYAKLSFSGGSMIKKSLKSAGYESFGVRKDGLNPLSNWQLEFNLKIGRGGTEGIVDTYKGLMDYGTSGFYWGGAAKSAYAKDYFRGRVRTMFSCELRVYSRGTLELKTAIALSKNFNEKIPTKNFKSGEFNKVTIRQYESKLYIFLNEELVFEDEGVLSLYGWMGVGSRSPQFAGGIVPLAGTTFYDYIRIHEIN